MSNIAAIDLIAPLTAIDLDDQQAQVLKDVLAITNVFELGSSPLFNAAYELLSASLPQSPLSGIGLWNKKLVTAEARTNSIDSVIAATASVLQGLTPEVATQLRDGLGLETVRALAEWPPFLTARNAIIASTQLDAEVSSTFDAVESIRPRIGEFPTERSYYQRLILLDQHSSDVEANEIQGPIDLNALDQNLERKPMVGALVTMSQSWFAQSLTLGHLLHSLRPRAGRGNQDCGHRLDAPQFGQHGRIHLRR